MKAYVYQAALLCEDCGDKVRRELDATRPVGPYSPLPRQDSDDGPVVILPTEDEKRPVNPNDESSYDSDDYPKGPYDNGGGEADTPQHCDHCGVFLENPLTPDGPEYIRNAAYPYIIEGADESWSEIAERAEQSNIAGHETVAEWIRFYFAPGQ